MTNIVLREKSDCIVSQSKKSRFLIQKHNNKKYFLQITRHAYYAQVSKKLVLILKNKIKGNFLLTHYKNLSMKTYCGEM